MTVSPGEEFRSVATPGPELLRKLAYLAAQDSDSVLTAGVRSARTAFRDADSKKAAANSALMLRLTRLADPAYQAVSARINEKLDRMDEASVIALQDIEHELWTLRREREEMTEQAYRDEQGRRIFMTDDESAAYYEDGGQLDEDAFAHLKGILRGRPTWEQRERLNAREQALYAERDHIHRHDAARDRLRDDLATGRISTEEADRGEREIEQAQPERLRRSHAARFGNDAAPEEEEMPGSHAADTIRSTADDVRPPAAPQL